MGWENESRPRNRLRLLLGRLRHLSRLEFPMSYFFTSINVKVSQAPTVERFATSTPPPPPSAHTYWPFDACSANFTPPLSAARRLNVKVSQAPIAVRFALTVPPPPC